MGFFMEFCDLRSFERSLNWCQREGRRRGRGVCRDLKDFRPISLVRGLYKLLAKVLENRLKKVVSNIILDF